MLSGGLAHADRAFRVTGQLEAPSIEAGLFELTGSATVPGSVEAGVAVRAHFRGDSALGAVRAPRVEVSGPSPSLIPTLLRIVFGGSGTVRVDRIEADSAEVSAAEVGFIRARQVVLGAGAHVTTVEGTIVRRHPSSRVGPESRSPPPHGLSR